MRSFREGDFSARRPNTSSGIDGRIAEVFNLTITQQQRIADQVTRLSRSVGKGSVGNEGRLNQRIKLSTSAGIIATQVTRVDPHLDTASTETFETLMALRETLMRLRETLMALRDVRCY